MTDELNNPWENINLASSKRVEQRTPHKFYWIKDDKGRSGLRINFGNVPILAEPIPKISGITSVILRHQTADDELFLIVMNPSDRDIFHTLCLDLITTSISIDNEAKLYSKLTNRLHHWQRFLSMGATKTMSEQLQMGLFAELSFLNNNVLPAMDKDGAITAWVGPDFDKQDFSFEKCLAEIKSFITSKGPFVKISSVHQLLYDTKPLFLISYGLTKTSGGISILNLINDLRLKLSGDPKQLDLFEEKLNLYGYFEGITEEPFFTYNTDTEKGYIVSGNFPRINPVTLAHQITAVQYTIDLSNCQDFEINVNSIFDICQA